MFAAIFICGLTVSSCNKGPQPTPDPDPDSTTRTVLAGMVAVDVPFFDSVTYSYEYDAQYRLVRSKAFHTPSDSIIQDQIPSTIEIYQKLTERVAFFSYPPNLFPNKSIINGDVPVQKSPNIGRLDKCFFSEICSKYKKRYL